MRREPAGSVRRFRCRTQLSGPWGASRATSDCRFAVWQPVTRLRGSEVVVESGTNSKQQPELRGQQWLRNVKGAGSATGDMLYNIASHNSGTKALRGQRVHRWRPRITYPLISLQARRKQGQQEEQRHTQGGGRREGCGRLQRVGAHQFDSGLVFWYGRWFARRVELFWGSANVRP